MPQSASSGQTFANVDAPRADDEANLSNIVTLHPFDDPEADFNISPDSD